VPAMWAVFTVIVVFTGEHELGLGQTWRVYAFSEHWARSPFNRVIGQAWTLNVEVRFYLLVGVVLFCAVLFLRASSPREPRPARGWWVVAIAALTAVFCIRVSWYESWLRLDLWTQLPMFMPGVALAGLEVIVGTRVAGRRWARGLSALLFAAGSALLIGFTSLLGPLGLRTPIGVARILVASGTLGVLGGLLLLQLSSGRCWRALDNAPLRWLGTRAYSFYLLHLFVLIEVAPHFKWHSRPEASLIMLAASALAMTLLLTEVMYRLIERPALRLRRSLAGWSPLREAT